MHRGHIQLTRIGLEPEACVMPTLAGAMLRRTRLFIPILSPEFLADPNSYALLALAVDLARRGQLTVVPLVVRKVDVGATPLHGWVRPVADERPLARAEDPAAALCEFVKAIREGLEPSGASRPRAARASKPARRQVLAIFASPTNNPRLQLQAERRVVEQALQTTDEVELHSLPAATLDDIHRALVQGRYDTVHISSHHDPHHGVILHDASGRPDVVDPCGLAELFRHHGIRDLVLNMCHSDQLVDEFGGFEHIVAMRGQIPDQSAVHFSAAFYRALAHGLSLERAFADARALVSAHAPSIREQALLYPTPITTRGMARSSARRPWTEALSLRLSHRFERRARA